VPLKFDDASLELSVVLPWATGVSGVGLMLSLFSDGGLKSTSKWLLLLIIVLLVIVVLWLFN
jgi:hypothetical protein